jgi:PPM family protein phosphatase
MMAPSTQSVAVHVTVAARTSTGQERERNEDALLVADLSNGGRIVPAQGVQRIPVGTRGVLLVVSDGLGGEKAGEIASALVVEGLARALEAAPTSAPPAVQLKHAAANAHLDVAAAARGKGREGMAATLTAVYVCGRAAYVAEVGDSRAYLLRAGNIRQLTRDQSLAQVLVDAGALGAEQAKSSPMRNVLAQAMGHGSAVKVALGRLDLRDRDCLLLCSDGLTGALTDQEIRHSVLESKTLDAACARLVSLANARGSTDDITVVLAGVGGDLPATPRGERVSLTYEILETFGPPKSPRRPDAPIVPAAVKMTR